MIIRFLIRKTVNVAKIIMTIIKTDLKDVVYLQAGPQAIEELSLKDQLYNQALNIVIFQSQIISISF